MRSKRKIKRIGFFLAALLLLQLSFHTIHILTSHTLHWNAENANHDTQTQELTLVCELCAKLLAPTSYLSPYLAILLTFVGFTATIVIREISGHTELRAVQLHRGPPCCFF